jgi:Domain of unknown function (DUF4371)
MFNQQIENEQIKTHHRATINKNWLLYYTWLKTETINENTFLFCNICRTRNGKTTFALGTTDLSLQGIKRHLITHEHKESESQLLNSNNIELNIEDQMDTSETSYNKGKLQIISLMSRVYFSSKKNLSLNNFSDLCELMSLKIENITELTINDNRSTLKPASLEKPSTPRSKYGSHENHTAALDFLDSIAFIIKKSLFEELNSSTHWSIMIDETNSVDGDKYLAIVGKCITNNIPFMRYLGMVNLDSTDGENIFNQIILFCNSNEISHHNIIHFGSDGASNMTGMKLVLK